VRVSAVQQEQQLLRRAMLIRGAPRMSIVKAIVTTTNITSTVQVIFVRPAKLKKVAAEFIFLLR
jgi:hypothetical protein